MVSPAPGGARDIAVVGGGIIGCSIARQLALEGNRVLLLERGTPGQGASGAAAGMLAAQAEAEEDSPLLEITLLSREAYRPWVADLKRSSGIDPEYQEAGLVFVALSADDEAELQHRFTWQRGRGLPVERLERGPLRRLLPGLAPDIGFGLLFPDDHLVDPRRLVRAAAAAAAAAGVEVCVGVSVSGLEVTAGRVSGVRCDERVFDAGLTILAAGCWTGELRGAGTSLPYAEPVRGQMLALDPGSSCPSHVVYSRAGYVVPRRSGHLFVGSTMERVGHDARPTADGVAGLLATAKRLLPDLGKAALVRAWAGLRPGSADGLPMIGFTEVPGLIVATGHLRNGILLAPVTAMLVADLVAGRRPRVDLTPFHPDRHHRQTHPGFKN